MGSREHSPERHGDRQVFQEEVEEVNEVVFAFRALGLRRGKDCWSEGAHTHAGTLLWTGLDLPHFFLLLCIGGPCSLSHSARAPLPVPAAFGKCAIQLAFGYSDLGRCLCWCRTELSALRSSGHPALAGDVRPSHLFVVRGTASRTASERSSLRLGPPLLKKCNSNRLWKL